MTTFFTIFTPCFNASAFIAETIQSVLAQNVNDWELILINDGSTDNTEEILNGFAKSDSRIRVIPQNNSGIAISRNRGIAEARGQWIVNLDHDDTIQPNALADIQRLIGSFPDAECFLFPCYTKNAREGIRERIDPVFRDFGDQCVSGPEAFRLLYSDPKYRGQFWESWRFVMRRDDMPRFTPGTIHEDFDVLPFHLAKMKSVCIAKKPFYLYTTDCCNSVTQTFTPARAFDICKITSRHYQTMNQISTGQSPLHLSNEVLDGFKAVLAFNLFGFYLSSVSFAEPERSQCLDFFQAHEDWLLAIQNPPFKAWIKRLILRIFGVKKAAYVFNLLQSPRRR